YRTSTEPQVQYKIRVFKRNARDRKDLDEALNIYVQATSPVLRTETNQIKSKFANPNNPLGEIYFAGLYRDKRVVGFVMFAFYPRHGVLVIDHIAIDESCRKHGSFYVFASLLQEWIENNHPDFHYVVVEINLDRDFTGDEFSGVAMVKLLRQLGFGQANVKYFLANMEPKEYRRSYRGALMMRGRQKMTKIRSEELLEVHSTILFDHYRPWFKDFFGTRMPVYEAHLNRLHKELEARLEGQSSVAVNGSGEDELAGPIRPPKEYFGLPEKALGHLIAFAIFLILISGSAWLLSIHDQALLIYGICTIAAYVGFVALFDVKAISLFEKISALVIKLLSNK
ncbi:MAG: hypothetical protein ACHQNE_08745, partial [Candidatus Kapaibacterium sp.]